VRALEGMSHDEDDQGEGEGMLTSTAVWTQPSIIVRTPTLTPVCRPVSSIPIFSVSLVAHYHCHCGLVPVKAIK